MKTDVYHMVTDRIIAELEAGTVPWKHLASAPLSQPMNLVSKRPYHGINYLLLSHSQFSPPYWLTFSQAQELGGHVRKGEKSEIVVFWKFLEVEDKETGEMKEIPFLRYYHVFNVEQTADVEYPSANSKRARKTPPIEVAEKIVTGMPNGPQIRLDDEPRAYYSPASDFVHMTRREACVSDDRYYQTLFHELTHSTGHKSRLNREAEMNGWHAFGTKEYSREELVAEMGAGFLCAECDIFQTIEEDAAAYIASWLTRLANDRTLVVTAAGKAQKAVAYILGQEPQTGEAK